MSIKSTYISAISLFKNNSRLKFKIIFGFLFSATAIVISFQNCQKNSFAGRENLEKSIENNSSSTASTTTTTTPFWFNELNSEKSITPSKVAVDANGNSYVVGSQIINDGLSKVALLAKFNPVGVLQWQKKLEENPNEIINGKGLVISTVGNIYLSGTITSPPVSGVPSVNSIFLTKLDNSGNLIWQRLLTDSKPINISISNSLILDPNENVYLPTVNTIIKYNSKGELQWQRSIPDETIKPYKGYDYGNFKTTIRDILIDSKGNIIANGYLNISESNTSGGTPRNSNYQSLFKIDPDGNLLKQKKFSMDESPDDPPSTTIEGSGKLAIDSFDNLYTVTTKTEPIDANLNAQYIIKFDPDWNLLANESYFTGKCLVSQTLNVSGPGQFVIHLDHSDNIVIGGVCGSEAYLFKLSNTGTLSWKRKLDGDFTIAINSLDADSSGNVLFAGTTTTINPNIMVGKIPSDGSLAGDIFLNNYKFSYAGSVLDLSPVNPTNFKYSITDNDRTLESGTLSDAPGTIILSNNSANNDLVNLQEK